jgi:hypothetical protein
MTGFRLPKRVALGVLLPFFVYSPGCKTSSPQESITVSLRNSETYQYPTVSGDEEGARISTQARHYSISEIRRDAVTNWAATYVYQPAFGFVGTDSVALEILTGSDGTSPPIEIKQVVIGFTVHN